eukprot:Hpha_TRINITY_DN16668_c0_g6::TRINITY_DN16668_c0_g6_i1::g.178215::m.178215
MGKCWDRALVRLVRDEDSRDDIKIKESLVPAAGFMILCAVLCGLGVYSNGVLLAVLGCGLCGLGPLVLFVGVVLNVTTARRLVDAFLIINTIGLCVLDLSTATLDSGFRGFYFVVLVLDVGLVYNRGHIAYFTIPFVMGYLAFQHADLLFRSGFHDLGYWGPIDYEGSSCNCAEPPCQRRVSTTFINYTAVTMVFLLDFYFTKRFAVGLRLQLRSIESSVSVSEDVAAALARYDVDEAEHAIATGTDLPLGLQESYLCLLGNLRSYRDYLPDALLHVEDTGSSPRTDVPPPVAEGGDEMDAAMVFTDVQSSTMLWEEYPQDMHEALQIHNARLRGEAKKNNGYEVKIIGDALMLAFTSATDAVMFGNDAHLALVRAEWPLKMRDHPLCQRVDVHGAETPLWNGLRVRIGIHWGVVRPEKNTVTGRYDYFGTAVNTAARVESAVKHGGLTGVTQSVVEKVGLGALEMEMLIDSMGEIKLNGIHVPVRIHVVLPCELEGRWEALRHFTVPSHMAKGQDLVSAGSASSKGSSRGSMVSRDSTTSLLPPKNPNLNLKLTASNATCSTVRRAFRDPGELDSFRDTEVVLTRLLTVVETAALRTQGQFVCVVSAVCFTAWNAGVRCASHVSQSARFITLLLDSRLSTYAGLATGRVFSGNVSGSRRRHVTVAGACVELSVLLSETAALRRLRFMAVGDIAVALQLEGIAKKEERWEEVGEGEEIEVWGYDQRASRRESTMLMYEMEDQEVEEPEEALILTRTFVTSFPKSL